jgi:hypothetical protein
LYQVGAFVKGFLLPGKKHAFLHVRCNGKTMLRLGDGVLFVDVNGAEP